MGNMDWDDLGADKWTRRWIDLAKHISGWSKDPSTKVGAVVVGFNQREMAVGYNGFPEGIEDTEERLNDRDLKYRFIQHAERNCLDNATFGLQGATLVVTKAPCEECAKSIVSKRITRVICPPISGDDRWALRAKWGHEIMTEACVRVDNTTFDAPEVLWHRKNGGHKGHLAGHALRLLNEAVELCVAAGAPVNQIEERVNTETKKAIDKSEFLDVQDLVKIMGEVSDVSILLEIFAHYAGCPDYRTWKDARMKVNHERKWSVDTQGVLWRYGKN